jgi:hypothetical protein
MEAKHDIRRHPNGIHEIFVEAPFDAFGAFLTLEAASVGACDYLERLVQGVLNGGDPEVNVAFNLFSLHCKPDSVSVEEDEELAPGVPRVGHATPNTFLNLLHAWRDYLRLAK